MRNTAPALLGDKVLASTDFVDQVTDLEGRAQLEAHVFHHHVTVEEQQSLPIDLMPSEEVSMIGQCRVSGRNVSDDFLHSPLSRVASWPGTLPRLTC